MLNNYMKTSLKVKVFKININYLYKLLIHLDFVYILFLNKYQKILYLYYHVVNQCQFQIFNNNIILIQ